MKMKKSLRSLFAVLALLVVAILVISPSRILAEELGMPERTVTLYRTDKNDDMTNDVLEAFSDPSVTEVSVINQWLIDSANQTGTEAEPIISPRSPYTLKNLRKTGQTRGANKLAEATGQPGVTVTIQKTVGVSNSYSCASGVDTGTINACVGFNVTGSESISISGSYAIPSTVNGRTVRQGHLIAYPLYDNYSYDVYVSQYYLSTGTAKKAVGYSFVRTHDFV